MDRVAWLLGNSTQSNLILEIGAGYNPVAPKAAGWKTYVVDHASRDDLRQKYQLAPGVNIEAIEDVDTIWRNGPLDAAIPTALHGRFDTLIASHLIEHMPDLAGFLIAAQRLLKPDGEIALAIPDMRYCFDCFRPISTTGDVLEAYAARRTRHSLRTAWDQVAYSVLNGEALAWGTDDKLDLHLVNDFSRSAAVYAALSCDPTGVYQDFHAWTFTPASFRLLILELGCLGITDWRIDPLHGPERFEFFARLRRGAAQYPEAQELQAERMALLTAMRREMLEMLSEPQGETSRRPQDDGLSEPQDNKLSDPPGGIVSKPHGEDLKDSS